MPFLILFLAMESPQHRSSFRQGYMRGVAPRRVTIFTSRLKCWMKWETGQGKRERERRANAGRRAAGQQVISSCPISPPACRLSFLPSSLPPPPVQSRCTVSVAQRVVNTKQRALRPTFWTSVSRAELRKRARGRRREQTWEEKRTERS